MTRAGNALALGVVAGALSRRKPSNNGWNEREGVSGGEKGVGGTTEAEGRSV